MIAPVAAQAKAALGAKLARRLGPELLATRTIDPDLLWFSIDRSAVRTATQVLRKELGCRFLISAGIDQRPLDGGYGVVHFFSKDDDHLFVALDCSVPEDDARLDSITPLIPGAAWSEQEFKDLLGVQPAGHPDPRRLVLPDDFPEGMHPLRRDFPYNYRPPAIPNPPPLKEPPPGSSVVPLGPFFPVLEEPARFRLFVEGETVTGCDYHGFYNHRGIEKLAESAMSYEKMPFLAERICGICGFIHSCCYCQAIEKAAGIVVPRRAEYIRTLMLELERIHSHLLWLGIAGHILGFDTVLMQTWRIREPVMWLTEEITGNRKTYSMNAVGGVRRDITAAQMPHILEVVEQVAREATEVRRAIAGDTTLHARARGVGPISPEAARDYCMVGPPARASGVRVDARLDHPYAAYDAIPPKLCVQQGCDVWARVLVRLDELADSVRIVGEALRTMPEGPIHVELTEIPDGRFGVSAVEAPRGEAIHFVMTGGDNRPYRWRVRAPTYPNLQAVPVMVKGQQLADVPISIGSLDPCFSCTERFEVVDVQAQSCRVYTADELTGGMHGQPEPGGQP